MKIYYGLFNYVLWGIKKYYSLKFVKYKNNFKKSLTSYITYDRIRKGGD